MFPGTTVELNCAPGFIDTQKLPTLECLESGQWTHIDDIIRNQYTLCEYDCKNELDLEKTQKKPLSTQDEPNDSIDSPWLVSIYRKNYAKNSLVFICNGNLVRQDTVVTAAHCINSITKYDLVVGYKSNNLSLENVSDENLVAKKEVHG